LPQFTTTEQRIMEALGHGMPVPARELLTCLPDELSGVESLRVHICNINKKLKPHREIVSVYRRGKTRYQLFRSIKTDE
jgi:DNA-binding winged helix-turn-helix (wHTH) protein